MNRRAVIDFECAYQRWKGVARRGNGDNLLIVDLGHSTIKALLAKIGPSGEVMVLDYASSYNLGISDGAVTDPARFTAAVDRAAAKPEAELTAVEQLSPGIGPSVAERVQHPVQKRFIPDSDKAAYAVHYDSFPIRLLKNFVHL